MSDGYINIGTKIDESGIDSGLKRVKSLLDDAGKYYATLGKDGETAFKKISDQLKAVEATAAITGDKIGSLAEKQKILKSAIESLISQGLAPEDLKVKSLQKAYDELTAIQASNQKHTNKSAKSIKESFADIRDFMQGPVAAAKMTANAIGKAVAVVKDLTDAYKKQMKAETQLESAAKNNPYLDSSSVSALKEYASGLQSISTFGDEELIPQMAKLAAAGRTQEEIMLVMSTATDMAASGAFSLESAVANLNKSYGGLSGELGESIPEIKSLTSEQLKNGEAVKLLAGRYKGIAQDVAKTTGTAEQLSNAMGDLKEELGAPFEKAMSPIRIFFTELIAGWANVKKAKREAGEAVEAVEAGDASSDQYNKAIAAEEAKLGKLLAQLETQKRILGIGAVGLARLDMSVEDQQKIVKSLELQVSAQNRVIDNMVIQGDLTKAGEIDAKKKADAAAAEAAKIAEVNRRNKEAADYIAANTAAREKALKQLELQAEADGRAVTAEEKLAVYAQSYVDLVSESKRELKDSNGVVTGTYNLVTQQNQAAVSLLNTVKEITSEVKDQNQLKEEAAELELKIKDVLDAIEKADTRPESEKMKERLAVLDQYYSEVVSNEQISADDKLAIEKEYAEKRAILAAQITDTEKEELAKQKQDRLDHNAEIAGIVAQFANQYAEIMNSIQSLATEAIENEAKIKTAKVEEQYEAGEISAEEYEAKINEINKKAAEEKYKIDMWLWGSQILSAVANTALGVAQTLADATLPTVARVALGALVGAAGAAQLTTIIANKPVPPSFATGGIVGGTSYTGDRVVGLMNSAEMILNPGQQRNLFDRINSGNLGGSSGANVQVYNSAANDVSAKPEITEDGIKIMIRKTVGKDMADGRFNNQYRTMQNGLKGVRLTN